MKPKTDEELKACLDRLSASKKPVILMGRFKTVKELKENHLDLLKHFKNAEYLWQAQEIKEEPGFHLGILLDEELSYVHVTLASKEVLNYLFEGVNQ